eukprot:CAMPEP_0115334190 /NCGR_PEP_ID=MMETSP0270-20121206/87775_1 /TAXON_ID=71861 /ORGANISM="Scrippsiella trochoidea, Strain CCMP3099" /LENGTH=768 /DNA_ID=CAMNT_0002755149 /DNA_START=153 /DNA_END=2454 /DNA_ORIENTATION=+
MVRIRKTTKIVGNRNSVPVPRHVDFDLAPLSKAKTFDLSVLPEATENSSKPMLGSKAFQQNTTMDRATIRAIFSNARKSHDRQTFASSGDSGKVSAHDKLKVAFQAIRKGTANVMQGKAVVGILTAVRKQVQIEAVEAAEEQLPVNSPTGLKLFKRVASGVKQAVSMANHYSWGSQFESMQEQLQSLVVDVFHDEPEKTADLLQRINEVSTSLGTVNLKLEELRRTSANSAALLAEISKGMRDATSQASTTLASWEDALKKRGIEVFSPRNGTSNLARSLTQKGSSVEVHGERQENPELPGQPPGSAQSSAGLSDLQFEDCQEAVPGDEPQDANLDQSDEVSELGTMVSQAMSKLDALKREVLFLCELKRKQRKNRLAQEIVPRSRVKRRLRTVTLAKRAFVVDASAAKAVAKTADAADAAREAEEVEEAREEAPNAPEQEKAEVEGDDWIKQEEEDDEEVVEDVEDNEPEELHVQGLRSGERCLTLDLTSKLEELINSCAGEESLIEDVHKVLNIVDVPEPSSERGLPSVVRVAPLEVEHLDEVQDCQHWRHSCSSTLGFDEDPFVQDKGINTRWQRVTDSAARDAQHRDSHGGVSKPFDTAGIESVLVERRQRKRIIQVVQLPPVGRLPSHGHMGASPSAAVAPSPRQELRQLLPPSPWAALSPQSSVSTLRDLTPCSSRWPLSPAAHGGLDGTTTTLCGGLARSSAVGAAGGAALGGAGSAAALAAGDLMGRELVQGGGGLVANSGRSPRPSGAASPSASWLPCT